MALNSMLLMKKANKIPKLKLAPKNDRGVATPNGKHTVIFIADQVVSLKNPKTNKVEPFVRFIFNEAGVNKTYDRPVKDDEGQLHYFIEQMSEVEEGEYLEIEMKKQGAKNYVHITRLNKKANIEVKKVEEAELDEDDESVVETDEETALADDE